MRCPGGGIIYTAVQAAAQPPITPSAPSFVGTNGPGVPAAYRWVPRTYSRSKQQRLPIKSAEQQQQCRTCSSRPYAFYSRLSDTPNCSFLSLRYHTELPTLGMTANGQGGSNFEARGPAPRGRGRKRCANAPFVTRCCPIPVPHLTCLLSWVDFSFHFS